MRRFDVFCRVVDNFGDVGVAWRLSRQLAAEHAAEVTLWIDDLASLARIAREHAALAGRVRARGLDAHAPSDVTDHRTVRTAIDAQWRRHVRLSAGTHRRMLCSEG